MTNEEIWKTASPVISTALHDIRRKLRARTAAVGVMSVLEHPSMQWKLQAENRSLKAGDGFVIRVEMFKDVDDVLFSLQLLTAAGSEIWGVAPADWSSGDSHNEVLKNARFYHHPDVQAEIVNEAAEYLESRRGPKEWSPRWKRGGP